MAQQNINTGSSPNNGTGDPIRTAFVKTEENFTDLYNQLNGFPFTASAGEPPQITGPGQEDIVLGVTGSISVTQDITASAVSTLIVANAVDSNTNINVGKTSISFNVVGDEYLKLNSNGNTVVFNDDGLNIDFVIKDQSGGTEAFKVDASTGNVGIQRSSPSYPLDINGIFQSTEFRCESMTTSDPEVAGQFFQTASEAIADNCPGFQIICLSEG